MKAKRIEYNTKNKWIDYNGQRILVPVEEFKESITNITKGYTVKCNNYTKEVSLTENYADVNIHYHNTTSLQEAISLEEKDNLSYIDKCQNKIESYKEQIKELENKILWYKDANIKIKNQEFTVINKANLKNFIKRYTNYEYKLIEE